MTGKTTFRSRRCVRAPGRRCPRPRGSARERLVARRFGGTVRRLVLVLGISLPGSAGADAVDDAFVRGNQAAAAQQWQDAVEAYEEAASLLSQPSALVSYNLGTAYAHLGDNGRATYHLARAMQFEYGATAELVEAARHNLGVVRRRVELHATAGGSEVDRPGTWWDLVVEALGAPGMGWTALVCGWSSLVALIVQRRARRRARPTHPWSAAFVVLGTIFAVTGILHGLALRADRTSPEAVVLETRVDAREGPGNHRNVEFSLQGGAKVRIVDASPGWRQVRLPGGLTGWVPEHTVARLDARKSEARRRPPPREPASE